MNNYAVVAVGAVVGVWLRYACMLWITGGVLWVVNIAGSLLMGLLNCYFDRKPNAKLKLLLTTGMLGSFTTFSAFSADWFDYAVDNFFVALCYAVGMTISCVFAAFIGYALMKRGEQ
jgi:fluoride exporter